MRVNYLKGGEIEKVGDKRHCGTKFESIKLILKKKKGLSHEK